MELEKCYKILAPTIRGIVKASAFTEDEVKELVRLSWEMGYDFRVQEELNKGASM